jgi:hypothetical protein
MLMRSGNSLWTVLLTWAICIDAFFLHVMGDNAELMTGWHHVHGLICNDYMVHLI